MGRPKGSKNKPKVSGTATAIIKPKAKAEKSKGWPPKGDMDSKVQSATPKCKNGTLEPTEVSAPIIPVLTEQPKTRGRKPTPKDIVTCEHCGSPIIGNPSTIKVNQLLGTGEYRFRAANMKPQLCHDCWQELVTVVDDWLLAHGNPEKFKNGAGKDGKVGD